jgi:transcription initiation factor TFIIA large subunit
MKMLHCGAITGNIERSRAPAAPGGGPPGGGTPGAGATPPVHDLNVPYEATSEEYATPTADMLFPPVRPKSLLCYPLQN